MACKKFATPTAHGRKNVLDDFPNGNAVDKVEVVPQDKELPLLESRCFLASFAKRLRNWQIGDREWALLRRTGAPFGSLIKDIIELDMNMEIVDALLGFWDEEHCGFFIGGVIIPFTVDDIALITGLPNRGQKVVRQTLASNCCSEFRRIYLTIRNIERSLDNILRNRNDPNPETDKQFVQQMILYLWGSVLFPSSCRIVPRYMAYYVKNLDYIGSFNWAEALHSFLVKEINAKSKSVKERNEGKDVVAGYMNGLCFVINVWFFEHVDFGEDSKPSNPDVKPRMLKWAKGCKFWKRKPFLQRFGDIMVDKVCHRLLPKNDEFELISLNSLEQMSTQIGASDDVVKGDPSLVGNPEVVGFDFRAGYGGMERRDGEVERETLETKVERGYSFEISSLTQVVLKQIARISFLERKIVNLETLAVSKGWEIEGMNDIIYEKAYEKVGYDLPGTHQESCIEGDKGHKVEAIGHPKLSSIARNEKKRCIQDGKRKMLKSAIAKEHFMLKKRRDTDIEKASLLSVDSSAIFERKDTDKLVNLDDYADPTEQEKEAKVAPLNYVGRALLTENVRKYLDAFCMKPMQRDDIVFFDWNICIQRHSMVEYLQGGYISEEIIDAYALILYKGVKKSGNNSASFLYVPPMFLGLYRNKLGSYKTFMNAVDKKSLEKVFFLFLPCHISTANHWLLLVCDTKRRKWIGYDSLYDARHREVAKDQIMILTEYLYQDHGWDIRSWNLEYRRSYPQQEPGTLDCGIFVMKFIESIIRVPMEINFRGTDMQLFRPQIAYNILSHC
ncbi:uncharacterized protein LOC110103724 isoform X1 [Dendrobium catenatum]|nr:uncharacterized protein LOC110103724 isoform X1 [Dendrobium catenatum]XP_020688193.2 uncharacterized protein LOC110103724 isoform X1 [Dendrobium catenatum]XP_020688195.2 uncharacterized protein LOC110103724 isoform X1 [Dendrobium catenatum]XP_020688196.2 uncharacterized protein LOC110103724 isoform X1 [Dendrobium catenatum]XP_028550226.1 uncharacterized protein LOC110103724 isoform X1 [Dendrobium catenatum]